MVAYALYLNDARIKAYVRSLEKVGAAVDVLVVREPGKPRTQLSGSTRIVYLTKQYRGDSAAMYVLSYFKFFFASFLTLSCLALRRRYTAVHVHNMPNLLIFTSVLPRLLGARLILDVHDLMPANYMAKFHVDDRHWLVRLLVLEQRVSAMMANYVFCADHSQGEFIERICGVPRRKLFVLLNLPNEDTFKPIKKARRNDVFELVYHGTIAHRLGIDILLRALAHLPDDLPVRLSIYGNGDFLDQARRLAEELRLGDRVYFSASFFPVEAIPEMVGSMDLGVVGNRRTLACDKFMLPVKLLEYVYLGVPVVAPRLEIIRRYFDEEMIKFYEPEDSMDLARCIVELYESPRERDLMARNASRFYDAYNWHAQAAAYLRLLSEQRA